MRCTVTGDPYTVFGYEGKQVRDNIHADDVVTRVRGLPCARRARRAVYNLGGGRANSISMLEAIALCERIAGRELDCTLSRRAADRRPPLVDLRPGRVPARLPGVGPRVSTSSDIAAGDPRRTTSSAGRRSVVKLSVVIPAHNEEGTIERDRRRDPRRGSTRPAIDYEIVVVDDGSTDATPAILDASRRGRPRVRGFRSHNPRRFGFAVRAGLDALQRRRRRDRDGRRLRDSPTTWSRTTACSRTGYDCAFGSRFIAGGRVERLSALKLMLNRIVNLGIRLLFRPRLQRHDQRLQGLPARGHRELSSRCSPTTST